MLAWSPVSLTSLYLPSVAQETMVAMECFFSEWFERVEGHEMGRYPPSNDTEVVQRMTKEGGVRSPP